MKKRFLLICSVLMLKTLCSYAQNDRLKYSINSSLIISSYNKKLYFYPNLTINYQKYSLFFGPAFDYYPFFELDAKKQNMFYGGYQYLFYSKNKLSLGVEIAGFYSTGKYRFYTSSTTYQLSDPLKMRQHGTASFRKFSINPGINVNWNFAYKFFLNHTSSFGLEERKTIWNYDDPILEDDISKHRIFNFILRFGIGYTF